MRVVDNVDSYKDLYTVLPESLTADAGYGSEENYHYLEENNIEAFVKYNYFHLEQKKVTKNDPFLKKNLYYNAEHDCFYCPMGQKMKAIGKKKRRSDNRYEQTYVKYQAQNCQDCSLRGLCHQQKENRTIEVNHKLRRYKEHVRELLLSALGLQHRKQRPVDV